MDDSQDSSRSALVISNSLVAAFEQTNFFVSTARGDVPLRIGQLFDGLTELDCRYRLAVVTAYNPFSQETSDHVNRERQLSLISSVEGTGLRWLPASGVDPTGEWPPEPSLAVIDPTIEQLDGWMEGFDQNAVVVVELGKPAVLRFHPKVHMASA